MGRRDPMTNRSGDRLDDGVDLLYGEDPIGMDPV
jgi:hypothetical protein